MNCHDVLMCRSNLLQRKFDATGVKDHGAQFVATLVYCNEKSHRCNNVYCHVSVADAILFFWQWDNFCCDKPYCNEKSHRCNNVYCHISVADAILFFCNGIMFIATKPIATKKVIDAIMSTATSKLVAITRLIATKKISRT
jgi:hypothetical protein